MRGPSATAGLLLAGLLALADLASPLVTDGEHPPLAVTVVAAALGAATLGALVPARRGNRAAGWVVVATRLLSAATAVPAFFVGDVPLPALVAACVVVGCGLLVAGLLVPGLLRGRQPADVPSA
jgi:hypothetical protein